jgi:hypothetical protein
VDIDRGVLEARLRKYFDPKISHEEMRNLLPRLMENSGRFNAVETREYLRSRGFLPKGIVPFDYRPFDRRWLYWEPETKLLDEKRSDYFAQVFKGNVWMAAVQQNRKAFNPPFVTSCYCSRHIIERGANLFPLWRAPQAEEGMFREMASDKPIPNLTDAAKEYLASLRLANKPEELFYHTLAVLHAPIYRVENASALRQDWPRVPLPESREALLASAELGRQVAALLDTETPVPGVTQGKPRPEFKLLAQLNYSGTADLRVIGGWGHAGNGGVTMPGKGKKLTRGYRTEEEETFNVGQASRLSYASHPPEKSGAGETLVLRLLGKTTHDIYLNDTAYWRNVPEKVWDYTIGGYQVLKKWLSYREHGLLGRALTTDEAREVTHIAGRLAALILLQPELDANYQRVKAGSHDWKSE